MGTTVFLIVVTLFWLIPIVIAHKLGGKNSWLWGLFLGWIGVLIVTFTSGSVRSRTERAMPGVTQGLINAVTNVATSTKKCPECAESVQEAANVCKHCHHRFEVVSVA
jgi:hypothetical protein